jgi:hypothetical protein
VVRGPSQLGEMIADESRWEVLGENSPTHKTRSGVAKGLPSPLDQQEKAPDGGGPCRLMG